MSPIVLDANLASQLSKFGQPVPLSDASGKVLGHFVPVHDKPPWEHQSPDISVEELLRRSKSTEPRYTTAEVLKYLEQL